MKTITMLLTLLNLSLVLAMPAQAQVENLPNYHDKRAIGKMTTGKAVFLVDMADAKKQAFYMDIIAGTHQNLTRQGVKPEMVVVYIGPSVKFLTTKPSMEVEMESGEAIKQMQATSKKLKELGVHQEVCSIATKVFGIDNATLFPEMTVIGDGFVSLIGYQAQGYGLVPVF
jgi:intracellular sulfur oxidation DsrE/DsrF family protein